MNRGARAAHLSRDRRQGGGIFWPAAARACRYTTIRENSLPRKGRRAVAASMHPLATQQGALNKGARMEANRIKSFDRLPNSAMVSDREIAEVIGINPATVWRWSKAGRLPPPVKIGERCTRWSVGAVRELLAQKDVADDATNTEKVRP